MPTCATSCSASGYDKRIGFEFLRPGPGWGGSCLPKDTRALLHIAQEAGYDFSLLAGAIASNEQQLARVVAKVETACGGSVDGVTVGVWGLTFKANTDDRRDSPSLEIAHAWSPRAHWSRPSTPPSPWSPSGRTTDEGARRPVRPGVARRPLRGGPGRVGLGGVDRVGRVPLARLRPRPVTDGRPLHRRCPQPARSGGRAPHGFAYTGIGRR